MSKERSVLIRCLCLSMIWCWASAVFPLSAIAQDQDQDVLPPRYIDVNFNGQMGVPLSTFKEKLSTNGYGMGGYFLVQIKRGFPVQAGPDISWQRYEREVIDYSQVIDGQERDFRLSTRINIVSGHAVMRFQPTVDFPVWPFIDGMIGVKYIYTVTTLQERISFGVNEQLSSDTDKEDYAFSYGIGGGVQIGLFADKAIRLEARVSYLPGASASYFARREGVSGPFNDPLEAFEEKRSPTTLLIAQLGLTVDIGRVGE